VLFLAIVGVLGFVGYSAWQKQSADAGGTSTVGSASTPITSCTITASPTPKAGEKTTISYNLKSTAKYFSYRYIGLSKKSQNSGGEYFGSVVTRPFNDKGGAIFKDVVKLPSSIGAIKSQALVPQGIGVEVWTSDAKGNNKGSGGCRVNLY
jgi:hypothetical protein